MREGIEEGRLAATGFEFLRRELVSKMHLDSIADLLAL